METNLDRVLARRKSQVAFALGLVGLFLAGLNVWSWQLYASSKIQREAELEGRLNAVGGATVQAIGSGGLDALRAEDPLESWPIERRLTRIRESSGVGAVFLLEADGTVLFDTRPAVEVGEFPVHLGGDTTLVAQALDGAIATGPLRTIEGEPFKLALVPVWSVVDPDRVDAVLGIDAPAAFMADLAEARRTLVGFGLASGAALAGILVLMVGSVRALIQTQEALREASQHALIGRLAPSIAHEIRNPLEVIKGTADVIRRKYAAPAEPDELFGFIDSEVERIDRLVKEFMSLARGTLHVLEDVDVEAILRRIFAGLAPRMENAEVKWSLTLAPALPTVRGDGDRIEQVALNLVVNAIDSLEAVGGGALEVSASVDRTRDEMRIRVSDEGEGIAADDLSKIFEPFYSTKRDGGTGLGLAVSRKIARDHGGNLAVGSEGGARGATFLFTLPVTGPPETPGEGG